MAMLDRDTLKKWISYFHESRVYCEKYGISDIFTLATLWEVDAPFMAFMRTKWDPSSSTFVLGTRRFCPTVEDFRAILMSTHESSLRLKPFRASMSLKKVLQSEYGISKNMSERICKDNVMDLRRWHDECIGDKPIPAEMKFIPMCVTMLLAHYLLVPAQGKPSLKVYEVALQLREGAQNIAAIVLAETLMGLNAQASVPEEQQRGSSFVLYMWLADKMRCLPPAPPRYITCYEVQKARLKFRTLRESFDDDALMHDTTPWHNTPWIVFAMDDVPRVVLLGLERATSYFTPLLATQFARTRMPSFDAPLVPFDAPITMELYKAYPDMWSKAQRMSVPVENKSTIDDYIKDPAAFRKKLAAAHKRPRVREPEHGSSSRPRLV